MLRNKVGEQNLSKMFGHFSLLFLFFLNVGYAGTFEDFKRKQTTSFQTYKNDNDKKFSNYLKSQWNSYSVEYSSKLYKDLKPKYISSVKSKKIKSVGPVISIKVKKLISREVADKKKNKAKDISFDFFGAKLEFDIPQDMQNTKFYPRNKKGISSFFDIVANTQYEYLIEDVKQTCKNLNLNDWATYLLVLKISDNIFANQDESRLLSWFIFNKLGYATKVGLSDKHVVLLNYSKKVIYSTPNYTFSNHKYYVLTKYSKSGLGKLYSYSKKYPNADMELNLSLKSLPYFPENMKNKILSFQEYGKTYNISYQYNQNMIDFMATYPQANYETFFNAPLDAKTYMSIASSIKKHIDGKKASEAINFVLHFVQNSFKYERDSEQFSREKVMFAEETLYYDKSDCEDRSILFAYLIKELFSISVIGVKYKDHMATALYIPMKGDSVKDGSRNFLIADPTYINSSIGQSMPKYKSIIPESFIRISRD